MLNRLSIRFRLNAALVLLAVLLAGIGTLGVVGMRASDATIKEIYSNQLASASLLGKAQLNAAIVRVSLDRVAFHPDAADVQTTLDKATAYRAKSEDAWERYKALPMSSDEAHLASEVEAKRATLFRDGIEPLIAALRAHDAAAADKMVMTVIPPMFLSLSTAMETLDRNQAEQAKAGYDAAVARSQQFLWLIVAAIGVGIAAAAISAFGLHRAISVPLSRMLGHFGEISRGNLTEHIVVTSRDEMGALTRAAAQSLEEQARVLRETVASFRLSPNGGAHMAAAASAVAKRHPLT